MKIIVEAAAGEGKSAVMQYLAEALSLAGYEVEIHSLDDLPPRTSQEIGDIMKELVHRQPMIEIHERQLSPMHVQRFHTHTPYVNKHKARPK